MKQCDLCHAAVPNLLGIKEEFRTDDLQDICEPCDNDCTEAMLAAADRLRGLNARIRLSIWQRFVQRGKDS